MRYTALHSFWTRRVIDWHFLKFNLSMWWLKKKWPHMTAEEQAEVRRAFDALAIKAKWMKF
jgi:hypothetical protein